MTTANNYGVLTFPLPLFNIAGKINVIIAVYESIGFGDGLDLVYKHGRPGVKERLFFSGDSEGIITAVAQDGAVLGGSLSSTLVAAPFQALEAPSFAGNAERSLTGHESVDEAFGLRVSTEDFLSGFFASSDTWQATGDASVLMHAVNQVHELIALADSIQTMIVGRVNVSEALALADALSIRVQQTLHLMEAATFSDESVAYSGALLGALERVTFSEALHYGLMVQLAEALTLADTVTRTAVVGLSSHEAFGVEGHASGNGVSQFIARERFTVSEPAPGTVGRDPYRAPYYLWGDGRWMAYYGDGVSGKLKDKP
jgi:hypothetical protein